MSGEGVRASPYNLVTFASVVVAVAVAFLWAQSRVACGWVRWMSEPEIDAGVVYTASSHVGVMVFSRSRFELPAAALTRGGWGKPEGTNWVYGRGDEGQVATYVPFRSRRFPPAGFVGRLGFGAGAGTYRGRHAMSFSCPHWMVVLIASLAPARRAMRTVRCRRRHRAGCCPACGYDLRATPDRCPECGTAAGGGD